MVFNLLKVFVAAVIIDIRPCLLDWISPDEFWSLQQSAKTTTSTAETLTLITKPSCSENQMKDLFMKKNRYLQPKSTHKLLYNLKLH